MDYKFYGVVKKNKSVFFIKNSYPQFEYINPSEYFTLIENSDIVKKEYTPISEFSNISQNTFVLEVCKLTEIITEDGLKDGKSLINLKLKTGDGYILRELSSPKLEKIYYRDLDRVSEVEYNFEKTFNIKELQAVDDLVIMYRQLNLITPSVYTKRVNIDKNFTEGFSTKILKQKPANKNWNFLSLDYNGKILTFHRDDAFGIKSTEETMTPYATAVRKIKTGALMLKNLQEQAKIINGTDSIINGYDVIFQVKKHVNINNISLINSGTIQI